MGVRAAAACDEPEEHALVELHGLARSEVIGAEDDRPCDAADPAPAPVGQGFDELRRNIPDIGPAGLHIFIIHGFQHRCELAAGCLDSRFRRQLMLLDIVLDHSAEVRILHHDGVHLKDGGLIFSDFPFRLFLQRLQLGQDFRPGFMEARQLRLRVEAFHQRHTALLPGSGLDQDGARRHTGRNPFSVQYVHGVPRLQIFFQEFFQCLGGCFFIFAFDGRLDLHTGFDSHSHDGEDPFQISFFPVAFHLAG